MDCPYPNGRVDETFRRADAIRSIPIVRAFTWGFSALAAVLTTVLLLNETETGTAVLIAAIGLMIAALPWLVIFIAAIASPPKRHFVSQVFQHDASIAEVEFDLWSECDHELATYRVDVVEPDGTVRTGAPVEAINDGRVARGGYLSIGNYTSRNGNFPNARPLEEGRPYQVVWYGRKEGDQRWHEMARHTFTAPIPKKRLLQAPLGRKFSAEWEGTIG